VAVALIRRRGDEIAAAARCARLRAGGRRRSGGRFAPSTWYPIPEQPPP
jgi:hypothetical protein